MKYFILKILLLTIGSISLTVCLALLDYDNQYVVANIFLFPIGLLLFTGLVPLFTIIVSLIHFLRHQYSLKFILFLFLSVISLFIFAFPFIFSGVFFLMWFFLPVAVVFSIAASLVLSKENTLFNVYSYILIMLFIIISPFFSSRALPYVYSPPALTSNLLNTSTDCIKFLVNHTKYKDLGISVGYWIRIDGKIISSLEESSPFSKKELDTIIRLRNELCSLGVLEFRKIDDFILFYKNTNLILPKGPGLLYSVNGQNPNGIDNEVMNRVKPFEKITDNWYMSRHLALGGPRYNTNTVVPKALIDHSLRTYHLDLKENRDIKHETSVKQDVNIMGKEGKSD